MVYEQYSVKVVDFMLESYGKESIRLDSDLFTAKINGLDNYSRVPAHIGGVLRDGEATLFLISFTVGMNNNRINSDNQTRLIILCRNIDNYYPLVHTYLWCSKTNTRCIIHGFRHVLDQLACVVINNSN